MIERYLRSSKVEGGILLIDIRHEPPPMISRCIAGFCTQDIIRIITKPSKMDKLNRSQIPEGCKTVKQGLEVEKDAVVIPFSAQTKQDGKKSMI